MVKPSLPSCARNVGERRLKEAFTAAGVENRQEWRRWRPTCPNVFPVVTGIASARSMRRASAIFAEIRSSERRLRANLGILLVCSFASKVNIDQQLRQTASTILTIEPLMISLGRR